MKRRANFIRTGIIAIAVIGIGLSLRGISGAHCDTLDGPVVKEAKAALEKGDIAPVLKWVTKENEKEIREQFDKTLMVRKQSNEAKALADRYFFETLVRIHRAGEGAPYTGLKAAGTVEPSVAAADRALESGTVDNLVTMISDAAAKGIRDRFERAREAKKHADQGIEDGRKFVAAYVEFTHYVERLHTDAAGQSGHGHNEAEGAGLSGHQH
ncbi:MAG: hypothetical protein FIA94_15045 [Nitrospirae bacterium]|nr:hypothetical protein [Nitrospirota bacterium]